MSRFGKVEHMAETEFKSINEEDLGVAAKLLKMGFDWERSLGAGK